MSKVKQGCDNSFFKSLRYDPAWDWPWVYRSRIQCSTNYGLSIIISNVKDQTLTQSLRSSLGCLGIHHHESNHGKKSNTVLLYLKDILHERHTPILWPSCLICAVDTDAVWSYTPILRQRYTNFVCMNHLWCEDLTVILGLYHSNTDVLTKIWARYIIKIQ